MQMNQLMACLFYRRDAWIEKHGLTKPRVHFSAPQLKTGGLKILKKNSLLQSVSL